VVRCAVVGNGETNPNNCLGLVSYLLVIYYQNVRSYGAGMLTVLSNRIGDVALMMGIA
jgi:NADH-ubiquinone oxidoreductase chain 5